MFNFLQTTIKRKSCLFVYVFFEQYHRTMKGNKYSGDLLENFMNEKKVVSFTSVLYVYSTKNVQVASDTDGVVLSSLSEN